MGTALLSLWQFKDIEHIMYVYHRVYEYKYNRIISDKLSNREIVSRSLFANPITNDAFTSLVMFNKHLNYI